MPWPSSAVNSGPRRLSQAHGITETCRNSQPTCSAASCSSPADRPDVQSQAHIASRQIVAGGDSCVALRSYRGGGGGGRKRRGAGQGGSEVPETADGRPARGGGESGA